MSQRARESLVIVPSAANNDVTSADVKVEGYSGGIFSFNVTNTGTTTALPTFAVQGKVPGTTSYYTIASVATTSTRGLSRIVIHPKISTADITISGLVKQENIAQPLPYIIRITSTNAGSGTVTYSAGVDWCL